MIDSQKWRWMALLSYSLVSYPRLKAGVVDLSLLTIQRANPDLIPERLRIGERIVLPVGARSSLGFRWPVTTPSIAIRFSVYGYCHAVFIDQGARLTGRYPLCSAGQQRRLYQPGLYFELRYQGQAVAPENYLPALPWSAAAL